MKKKKRTAAESQNNTQTRKQNTLTVLSFALTIVFAVLCGLFFTFGAKASGYAKLADRDLPAEHIKNIGVRLNDGVTAAQVSEELRAVDENYGGFISQHSVVMSSVTRDGKKKELKSYALIFDENLQRGEGLFVRSPDIVIPEGCFAAYYTGWEWSDKNLGEHCRIAMPKADGGTAEIDVVIAGTVSSSVLTLGAMTGEPYVYSNRSLLAVEGYDIRQINSNAEKELYFFTDIDTVALAKLIKDNNFGTIYEPIVVWDGVEASVSAIYKSYLYIIALVLALVIISFTGGLYRVYNYLVFGGVTVITMLMTYFIKIRNDGGLYAYVNTFNSWYLGLLIGTVMAVLLATIIARAVFVVRNRKFANKEKDDKNDKTAKYI